MKTSDITVGSVYALISDCLSLVPKLEDSNGQMIDFYMGEIENEKGNTESVEITVESGEVFRVTVERIY